MKGTVIFIRHPFKKNSFLYRCVKLFFRNDITAAAAEMAYFLIFAFFPLLMVVHASLSMAIQGFDLEGTFFYTLLPHDIEALLDSYLDHVGENSNMSFLVLGIGLTIYTLSKFIKSVKRTIRRIYSSRGYAFPLAEWGISLVLSVLILVAFFVSLFLLILGGQILNLLQQTFPMLNMIRIQALSRVLFTAAVIYSVVTLFYFWIPNVRQRFRDIFPGTFFTSLAWVLVSGIFSFYMNNFANYSLIYGSIGAFIMLLLWIYVSCLILLLGAVINAARYTAKQNIGTLTEPSQS